MHSIMLEENEKEEICNRVRFFRKREAMTQQQLGLVLGASTGRSAKAMIAKIEGGQVPGGMRLRRLAEALGCSADILLSGRSRELMEVIRYHVPVPVGLDAYQRSAFRVGRVFLFCAVTVGELDTSGEFVEAANRLFYLAERDPEGCLALFSEMPKQTGVDRKADLLAAKGDLRGLVRHAMQFSNQGRDPVEYADYAVGVAMAQKVNAHYIRPEQPPLSIAMLRGHVARETYPAPVPLPCPSSPAFVTLPILDAADADGVSSQREPEKVKRFPTETALVRVEGKALEPLLKEGHYAMVAGPERAAAIGDLVVCWTKQGKKHFGRLVTRKKDIEIASLSPMEFHITHIKGKDVFQAQVITGVMFE